MVYEVKFYFRLVFKYVLVSLTRGTAQGPNSGDHPRVTGEIERS